MRYHCYNLISYIFDILIFRSVTDCLNLTAVIPDKPTHRPKIVLHAIHTLGLFIKDIILHSIAVKNNLIDLVERYADHRI